MTIYSSITQTVPFYLGGIIEMGDITCLYVMIYHETLILLWRAVTILKASTEAINIG